MEKENQNRPKLFNKKWLYCALAAICVLLVFIPTVDFFAKYITNLTTEDEITAALFFMDGEYAQEIQSEGETPPEVKVSGWKDDIVLKFYNHKNGALSEVDITCSCEVTGGWTVPTEFTLTHEKENEYVIRLKPSSEAKKGDKITFTLTTAPYEVKWQATFVLTDSNKPDWTLEDKGAYALLTVQTNDFKGNITVNYEQAIFAPDSTNTLMKDWVREEGTGTFAAERFTTYQLMLFEEQPDNYTFEPSNGSGGTITVTVQR